MPWYHKRLTLTRPSGQAAQSAEELQIDHRQDAFAPFSVMMVGALTRERGGIGIRSGLKIRRRKACGFESHRSYQGRAWLPDGFRPMAASGRKGLEPMRWNSVKKTAQWAVFRNSPEGFSLRGRARESEAGVLLLLPRKSVASRCFVLHEPIAVNLRSESPV